MSILGIFLRRSNAQGFALSFKLLYAASLLLVAANQAIAQTAQQIGVGTGTKFHVPSVPAPKGQDPWGPARELEIGRAHV